MLPKQKPSCESQREQAKLPGPVHYRAPKGDAIEPRSMKRTRSRAPARNKKRAMSGS
jgi:hypothetical protein